MALLTREHIDTKSIYRMLPCLWAKESAERIDSGCPVYESMCQAAWPKLNMSQSTAAVLKYSFSMKQAMHCKCSNRRQICCLSNLVVLTAPSEARRRHTESISGVQPEASIKKGLRLILIREGRAFALGPSAAARTYAMYIHTALLIMDFTPVCSMHA